MEALFESVSRHALAQVAATEVLLCSFSGEEGDFVRFNRAKVRQAGSVRDPELILDLGRGGRHVGARLTLSGDVATDLALIDHQLPRLRAMLEHVPEDPHWLYSESNDSSHEVVPSELPPSQDLLTALLGRADDLDMVGILAAGFVYRGFANSLGQRNWFATRNFHADWSLYDRGDKAVKTSYAGTVFDPEALDAKLQRARARLALLARPSVKKPPGEYRVFMAPAAVAEFVGLVGRDGFSENARRRSNSCLGRVAAGEPLSPMLSLSENNALGLGPRFGSGGFAKPSNIPLIEGGACAQTLVNPRAAKEFGVPCTGSGPWENPESLDMAAGGLSTADALAALDTGVWIGHLHYLNFSDHPAARLTGMTRFATFWVEDGEVVAPLDVMRFDETVARVLGENLRGLTVERELFLNDQTYSGRSTGGSRVPGALVDDFRFTL